MYSVEREKERLGGGGRERESAQKPLVFYAFGSHRKGGSSHKRFKSFILSVYTHRGEAERELKRFKRLMHSVHTQGDGGRERQRQRSHKRCQGLVYSVYGERVGGRERSYKAVGVTCILFTERERDRDRDRQTDRQTERQSEAGRINHQRMQKLERQTSWQ